MPSTLIFRNRLAAFGWGFSGCFLLFCGLFTYILFRDGTSHIQVDPPADTRVYASWVVPLILAVFWAAGIGLAAFLWRVPIVRIEVVPGGPVRVRHAYPWRSEIREFAARDVLPATVAESKDSDGDPYFKCILETTRGFSTTLAEGHDQQRCEASCGQFNAALGTRLTRSSD